METKAVLGVVLSFGVAFAMLSGAGLGAVFGEDPDDHETTRAIEALEEDASVDEDGGGVSVEVAGDSEPTLVGMAIAAGQFAVQLVVAVGLLPVTLMQFGFPRYAAYPLGLIAQSVALIGLFQFVRGTEYL